MSKNKLAKFADMAVFENVFQVSEQEARDGKPLTHPSLEMEPGKWGSLYFGNDNPIVLELGCGRGEYTVGLALRNPNKNFIGVDIKGSRMWTGAKEALEGGLKNVAFLRTTIEFIDRFFAAGEVAEIWLTFSDPQMKKVTKRLTSTYFLERYRRIMCDKGIVHVKTDSNFLFTYTQAMAEHNRLPVKMEVRDLYAAQLPKEEGALTTIQTYYEQQWLKRGITIKYIRFALPQEGELDEPNVEIELDSYRSYNRNKRSSLTTSK